MNAAINDPAIAVDVDQLIQLRRAAQGIGVNAQRITRSSLAGGGESRFRGRGMDYRESRGYQPGDDIRSLDWRVMARTGRPHTKIYCEERERPVMVAVDFNASMFFATRRMLKSCAAAQVAALIAWACVQRGDRVGGFLFGGGDHAELTPRGGRHGALALIRALASRCQRGPDSARADAMADVLQRIYRVARPGSLLFIISDCYTLNEECDAILLRLRQHLDIMVYQLVDALELAPPPPGRYAIGDGVNALLLDTRRPSHRHCYQQFFARHHQRIENVLRRRAIALQRIATDDNFVTALRRAPLGRR